MSYWPIAISAGLNMLGGLFGSDDEDVAKAGKYQAYPGQATLASVFAPYLWESLNAGITDREPFTVGTHNLTPYEMGSKPASPEVNYNALYPYMGQSSFMETLAPYIEENLKGLTTQEWDLYRGEGRDAIATAAKGASQEISTLAASQGLKGGSIANILAGTAESQIPAFAGLETEIAKIDIEKKSQSIQDALAFSGLELTEKGIDLDAITKVLGIEADIFGTEAGMYGMDLGYMSDIFGTEAQLYGMDLAALLETMGLNLEAEGLDFAKQQKLIENILAFLGLKMGEGGSINYADLDLDTPVAEGDFSEEDIIDMLKKYFPDLFRTTGYSDDNDTSFGNVSGSNTGGSGGISYV
jgi:hypothetical protein